MQKVYVLDTSVLIHDPQSIKSFEDSKVVIPLAVLSELDAIKAGNSQKSYSAREASRELDKITEAGGKLTEYNLLPESNNTYVRVYNYNPENTGLPKELDISIKDNQILATLVYVQSINPDVKVILVSKDTLLRLIADSLGLLAEDYRKDKIKTVFSLGKQEQVEINITEQEYEFLIGTKSILLENYTHLKDHTWVTSPLHKSRNSILIKTTDRNNKDKALIKLIEAKKEEYQPWDLRAKNEEQLYALYLLLEPSIKIITISGTTGSGKSILTLAAGMQLVDSGKFDRMVVIRPMVAIGEEVGFLPGSLEDKLGPWTKPIYDNLCFMLNDPDGSNVQHYFDHKKIEVAPFTYLRGRSINNAFIYVDEAQNVSLHAIKSAISRAGNKSKVILAGDLDQIDNLYTDRYSCGLTHVAEAFKNESIAGTAILSKSERSKIAELAAQLL